MQHWGFKKRFDYDPNVPKKGERLKPDAMKGVTQKKRKSAKPGPGAYKIGSVWNLNDSKKNQDI